MKLTIILSTKNSETNWNAFRLANLALNKGKGDVVNVFLIGEGVEYDNGTSQFNIREQINKFLGSTNAKIIACGTCMNIRGRKDTRDCPKGGIADLYNLIVESDKVITF